MPRILFVSGFHPATRARDLAFEFERYALSPFFLGDLRQTEHCLRYGPLIRCDVPAPRNPSAHSNPYVISRFVSSCSSAAAPRVPSSPHVRPSSPHAHACTHLFDSNSSAVVFPRHSTSRRVRTKAQRPSTVAVTHSLSFAAPAMPRMPIMTCMTHIHPFLSTPDPRFFFSGTDACLRVHA
jgi:hypothetical protein